VAVAIVTGSGGLIGSESVRNFVEAGDDVIGLENDMRREFFDIRDADGVERVFGEHAGAMLHGFLSYLMRCTLTGEPCSMVEAIGLCERIAGRELDWTLSEEARTGDHRWWISDLGEFTRDYPDWSQDYDLEGTLHEIHDENAERWSAVR
jgi:NAD(P)-dependent dehydrogenase (short-subunit alcohol dehydrogenase family)